ncbi:BTB/POZ domain-containing protein At4g30940-like [Lycium barbarum]|uniref:BTB/POZ domain-containing protein At4g30940-like n=1 Tax=Lycium barbarum TaxID=112863 RepID=UPI00293EEBD7|nr:BTB/POZ domain-containing protein At4g30940-like [Lycium barbarum]
MGTPKDRVKFNVGGRIFETTATTLAVASKNSLFGAMLDENWNLLSNSAITEHFIDRNPDCFGVLLDLLRTGELYIPPNIDKKLLYREAEYYGILDHVRSATWGPLDGNRLQLARSITDRSDGDSKVSPAIQAGPNGWCSVAQGNVVRVYNWMLEEHPIIHFEHDNVNDVCWVDSENIVVSSTKKLDSGGMGLFSASTGKSKYKFQVTNKLSGLAPFATAGALEFGSNYKLFSSCEGTKGNRGIGVWDLVTGKLIDFLRRPLYCKHVKAGKLQWLHDTNCLMVLYFGLMNDIRLFDFRENAMVWSLAMNCKENLDNMTDAIVIEESSSICVVDWYESLGFMDLRSTDKSVNWRKSEKVDNVEFDGLSSFSRLAFHKGQLFSSMKDRISVYCGSDWLQTSKFRQGHGGKIIDFSIGGDRLFALHNKENVIEVWETPRPPII